MYVKEICRGRVQFAVCDVNKVAQFMMMTIMVMMIYQTDFPTNER